MKVGKNMFRLLKADEIDVRVQSYVASSKGAVLLLYKDARCDMNILDETVGNLYWKREHKRDNANCVVSIYNKETKEWVSKEDTGTESNTEKEKGMASDSFKRACFNWGIGRELYTSPFIWVNIKDDEVFNGKIKSSVKFYIKEITYKDNKIDKLVIVDNKDNVRFTNGSTQKQEKKQEQKQDTIKLITKEQKDVILKALPEDRINGMLNYYKIDNIEKMTFENAFKTIQGINSRK